MDDSNSPKGAVPAFSVVVPCFNSAAYLGQTLESIRSQTWPASEIIVVDDMSSDASVDIARKAGARVLSTGTNSGPSRARNLGIQAARSAFVAFVDADDYWEPTHLEELAGLIARCPSATVFYSRVRMTDGVIAVAPLRDPAGVPLNLRERLFQLNPVPQSAAAARRLALLEIGGYDESRRFSEDFDLWLRLSRTALFAASHAITVNYRIHPGQATRQYERLLRGGWEVRIRELEWVRRHGSPVEVARVVDLLQGAWRSDLQDAWHARNLPNLELALAMAPVVPESGALHTEWRRRRRLWWLWTAASSALDRVPPGLQRILRDAKRRWSRGDDHIAPAIPVTERARDER
jgi:glycosyltransferase involved in cell wall biosynthesis